MNIEKNVWVNKGINILAGLGFLMLYVCLMDKIIPYIIYTNQFSMVFPPTDLQRFFMGCVIAPVWETLYIAVPITLGRKIVPEHLTLIMFGAAACFGWAHGYGQYGILIQGVSGLVFSMVYVKNGDCYLSAVLLHALYNGFLMYE